MAEFLPASIIEETSQSQLALSRTLTLPSVFSYDASTGPDSMSWLIVSTPTSTTAQLSGSRDRRLWSMLNGETEWRCITSPFSTTSIDTVYLSRTATTITSSSIWTTTTQYDWSATDWEQIHKEVRAPAVKKSTRNSIKRALKLMTGLGFEEDVRIFLNGDSIEVSHPDSLLKFVITKYSRSLIRRTEHPGLSTPYRLELYTKSDVHVADLCVYMEETPVLDQVLGVAMFIKSGSEEMILSQANWSSITDDMEMREILALEYPYLKPKLRLNDSRFRH